MPRSTLPRGFLRFYNNNGSKLLRLPQELALNLPDDQIYRLDVDEDGIHLRPVESVSQALPAWARRSKPAAPAPANPAPAREEDAAEAS